MRRLQRFVAEKVERGYGPSFHRVHLFDVDPAVIAQVLKAIDELGEVADTVFQGQQPPASELADVVIPLMVLAEYLGIDLLAEVKRRVDEKCRPQPEAVRLF